MKLRIHQFLPVSYANGPGCRAVLWVQGCPLHCPGCYNPDTHAFDGGQWVTVRDLAARVLALGPCPEGITISGGEPLAQAPALVELLHRIKNHTPLSVIVFTGYTWAETQSLLCRSQGSAKDKPASRPQSPTHDRTFQLPDSALTGLASLLQYVDVLIAGRYCQPLRVASGLRGSANKTIHFLTNRYSLHDIEAVPAAEIILYPDGGTIVSGIEDVEVGVEPRSAYTGVNHGSTLPGYH
jgi:anaerobic ribonucleoside-triphosphate reductase activating protein